MPQNKFKRLMSRKCTVPIQDVQTVIITSITASHQSYCIRMYIELHTVSVLDD